uniref:KIAA0319 n=1 Tax=Equus asinus asinus TaxID=83772 RepID=A0A8C4PKB0_EQUAS
MDVSSGPWTFSRKCWMFICFPDVTCLSSSLESALFAGCACTKCSEGRTYSNAIILPNLETTRIMRVPQTTPTVDCIAACCDLSSCDLAWWFEGRCYLVSCPHKENCEPKKMDSMRSYLTFVVRPAPRPAQLLDFGEMMLKRGSPSGIWGDSPEDIRKDLPFLGKDGGLEEMSEYSDDYQELEQDVFQPISKLPSQMQISLIKGQANSTPQSLLLICMKELMVSAGDNIIITLPKTGVELKAFVVPAPPAETTYNYEWSLISHPVDYQDEIKERHAQTLNLSQLSVGFYAFKVAVSSDNAFGEGFVNVTVKPARRVNLPPIAVVSPQIQELTLPLTSALIDGSQSTDDANIVSYHWEEMNGPLGEEKMSADSPVLRLSNLVPGNYSFRLTVTDSDGASNSTIAALIVNSAVDHPPVANAGPNQTITLPQNSITLNGNQSSDDHQIVLYEWSLGPGSESKEVAMQGVETPYLHLSAMQEGDYTFQLMVTDSSRQQSTAVVTVIVQPENNRPPVAVAGPSKELVFPVESTTLDGSRSSDDHGIVFYHWEGPSAVEMENADKAVATVTGLQVGTYHFRLTVKDQQGLSSTTTLTVAVKKENNSPPRAQAGGRHVLVLPNNSITLDGSRSTDDHGIVSYLWIRDGQSPAAGDVLDGSDRSAALQLTNLVEGVYTFHLRVTDGQGASDTDTATVEVRPDPRKSGLVELILQVGIGQLTEQQKDTLVRQLAVLLNVLDSDIKVQKIQAHSDLSTVIVFYVQSGPPFKVLKAAEVVQNLHRRLSKEKTDFLLFKVLRIDTAGCLLKCSGHGHCDPITKRCICSQLWMENLIQRYIRDGESNCEWSVFYVAVLALTLVVLTGGLTWLCVCCCKRYLVCLLIYFLEIKTHH